MITVLRVDGVHVVIYVNDHHPAHVHAFADGEAKVNLIGENAPLLIWANAMSRRGVRRCMRVVTEHLHVLRQKWEDIHGGTD
jgi:hypothetical protein